MKRVRLFFKNFWTRLVEDHRQITAIYQKDLFQIILSPMFSIICLACCIFFGFTYIRSFIVFADQSFSFSYMGGNKEGLDIHRYVFIPLMSQMNLLLIFIVPALTMRLFAEEKKLNTFDLLMSAPLTSFQIVFGKFLAAYKSALILIVLSFIYVAFSGFFADFNWNMPLVSYLGLMLLSMIYVSLGILASSLTQSMVLGVILGVIFNLFLWFAGQACRICGSSCFHIYYGLCFCAGASFSVCSRNFSHPICCVLFYSDVFFYLFNPTNFRNHSMEIRL